MPNKISVSIYPNNEVRAIIGRETTRNSQRSGGAEDNPDSDSHESGLGTDVPLDITSKLSGSAPPGFGGVPRPTRFGNNARRTISRCAGVFDVEEIPPSQFILFTGTIPGGTPKAFEAMARWSSWVVKNIKTWISGQFIQSAYSMYVWEFQKRGALHIHYCLHCPDPGKRDKLIYDWKAKWTEIIDGVCSRSGVDLWERRRGGTWATNKSVIQADAQVIKKSVGAYLSKYLSKNAPTNEAKSWGQRRFHGPVRWWGASRPLLKRCRELTENFKVESIAHSAIRYLKEKLFDIMNWSENKVRSYWDKARSTNVLLTYSPENCQMIYSYLKRDLCRTKIATRSASTIALETGSSQQDSNSSKKPDKEQSSGCHGQKQKATICHYLQPCLWETPATWSACQNGPSSL